MNASECEAGVAREMARACVFDRGGRYPTVAAALLPVAVLGAAQSKELFQCTLYPELVN